MHLGCKILSLSIKHQDGEREWTRGAFEVVMRGDTIMGMEYHDIVILEHFDDRTGSYLSYLDKEVSLQTMIEIYADKPKCSIITTPRAGPHAIFLFKDEPMVRYRLLGNEMISEIAPVGATDASILNNMCGKVTCDRGLSHMIRIT